jgi:RND family efflux transporter MFP subunit
MEITAALFELASVSLACRDQETLLKTVASRVEATVGARAVFIWLGDADTGFACRARYSEPGERFSHSSEAVSDGLLTEVFESGETLRLGARDISARALTHLNDADRGRIKSAVYAVLPGPQGSKGVVEVLGKRSGEFSAEEAQFVEEASRLAGHALTNLEAIEEERRTNLATMERLTALYDIGRTFTSTLELSELLPVVAEKIRDILGASACNVWLPAPEDETLYLAERVGEDPTAEGGARVSATEGLLGEVAQQASPKLVEEPAEEPGLDERRQTGGDFEIQTWMAAPLRKEDAVLGVIELVNKSDGTSFNEEDLFLLASISEQAAIALHNANLLESERKVHALDALLKISQEITSTLDLDHVLMTVAQQAASVVPFDKCVIGFFDRGRFILGAVSGEAEVPNTRLMSDLRERLEWMANQEGPMAADLYEDGWHVSPEDVRAQIVSVLEANDFGGFYALPLRDEQGALGTLALLSGDADFLTANHKETLAILGNQTSVAIRNAQLYQQVPLANLFQPLAKRKQKLMSAVSHGRWRTYAERAAVLIAALILIPWPMRVGAVATVVPAERRIVSTIEGGVVQRVFVHEGDTVQAGQVLAQLDSVEDSVKLAEAQASLAQAQRDLAEAEFKNDGSAAGQAKARADLHAVEVQLEQERVSQAQLRAPIAGMVVTPKIEQRTGTMLKPGDAFAEIVTTGRMAAEMSVPEGDLALIRTGKNTALKLNAYPTTTFEGTVERIGAQTRAEAGVQYFLIRAVFDNQGGLARDGMVGQARIRAAGGWFDSGWHPVGYVLLRDLFAWAWQKVWAWLP